MRGRPTSLTGQVIAGWSNDKFTGLALDNRAIFAFNRYGKNKLPDQRRERCYTQVNL